jgi:hypothetical protein
VDDALRTLAEAGLALDAAAEALAAGERTEAETLLEQADAALAAARACWPELTAPARAVIGPAGRDLRERRDGLARRLPKRRSLSDGAPLPPDPDEERPPEE